MTKLHLVPAGGLMYTIGNEQLLQNNPIAIYCSREIPLSIYQPALELVQALLARPVTLAGGWLSALEKAALKSRTHEAPSNIIFFLAKGINDFMIPADLRGDLDAGRALFISPFLKGKRIDRKMVARRDELILSHINRYLFLNINEGGNLDKLFDRCLQMKKDIFLLDHFSNHGWVVGDTKLISTNNLGELV